MDHLPLDDQESKMKEDEDHMLLSPQAVASLFPSRAGAPLPSRESVLQRLSEALMRRTLTKIDLSQRCLMPNDARLVKMALLQNRQLAILKLAYNNLGDYGTSILADGISKCQLKSLDLGFNNISDEGCTTLCRAIPSTLQILYLAGNLIGEEGALAVADLIQRSALTKLYFTGNRIGAQGVKAITEAIIAEERMVDTNASMEMKSADNKRGSMEELYLGGCGMGTAGCQEVANLLAYTRRIRVLSLSNCEINDEDVKILAESIKANRENLPLQSLQLSFNNISCKGIESLSNAMWGLTALKELLLDNNEIADRGAQHIAAVLLPQIPLETLDLGFNRLKTPGIKMLMKAVLDCRNLKSLSVSGNPIDTTAAKSIAFSLAYNRSLRCLSLVHCNIQNEGKRHISAGIVSNSRTSLQNFTGFSIGPAIVSLGFPPALEHWSNVQIMNFIHYMWENTKTQADDPISDVSFEEEEKLTDPLNFLGDTGPARAPPLEAKIVVEVATKTYASLLSEGIDILALLSGRPSDSSSVPLFADENPLTESGLDSQSVPPPHLSVRVDRRNVLPSGPYSPSDSMPSRHKGSFVASPVAPKHALPDPDRKKRISVWLSANLKTIQELGKQPFNSVELWRLHQHFFTPVVNESGGENIAVSSCQSVGSYNNTLPSVPDVSRASSTENPVDSMSDAMDSDLVGNSHPSMKAPTNPLVSLPLLKRKVSYRTLGDAALSAPGLNPKRFSLPQKPIALMIEGGPGLPPTTKRARRNRTRISFLPRVKAKVESHLDVCHEKALATMRQLYYVEQAILGGRVNPLPDPSDSPQTHLCGDLATDAEMILLDMI